jgi:PIN domain nuclease of toxin-antitoxin system
MKFLLDTHIWLERARARAASKRVKRRHWRIARTALALPISVWETLVLARKKRVIFESTPEQWVRQALSDLPIREAPTTHEVAIRGEALRLDHKDPADRFIVATALVYELTLVTADKRLVKNRQVPILANRAS